MNLAVKFEPEIVWTCAIALFWGQWVHVVLGSILSTPHCWKRPQIINIPCQCMQFGLICTGAGIGIAKQQRKIIILKMFQLGYRPVTHVIELGILCSLIWYPVYYRHNNRSISTTPLNTWHVTVPGLKKTASGERLCRPQPLMENILIKILPGVLQICFIHQNIPNSLVQLAIYTDSVLSVGMYF